MEATSKEKYITKQKLIVSADDMNTQEQLDAMDIIGDRQDGAIRFSFSPFNTVEEADTAAQYIEDSLNLLRRFRRR